MGSRRWDLARVEVGGDALRAGAMGEPFEYLLHDPGLLRVDLKPRANALQIAVDVSFSFALNLDKTVAIRTAPTPVALQILVLLSPQSVLSQVIIVLFIHHTLDATRELAVPLLGPARVVPI